MSHDTNYRPEIDGLRAVAVLSVIAFHLNPSWLPGGFLGVDIFFVISGYVITATVLRDLTAGTYSLVDFYKRRARRILPALIIVVTACLPFAWLLMDATELQAFGQSLLAQVAFASNFLFWQTSGYFAAPAETVPLLHTWSLAVEEQFYLFFPPLLFLSWRLAGRQMFWILLALAALSVIAANHFVWADPSMAFYLLPFRGWELLAGALLAHLEASGHAPATSRRSQAAAAVGLVLVGNSLWTFTETSPHPSLQTLPVIIGACLIVRYARTGPAFLLLSLRPIVGAGLISYSLYLWHWPMLAFTRLLNLGDLPASTGMWMLPTCLALAWLTWRFVEQPARRQWSIQSLVGFSGGAASIAGALGVLLMFAVPAWTFANLTMTADQRYIYSFLESNLSRTEAYEYDRCFVQRAFDQPRDNCSGISEPSTSALLWGDSHAASLAYGLRSEHPNLAVYATSDCAPFLNVDRPSVPYCADNNNYVLGRISDLQPGFVLLLANWIDTAPLEKLAGTIKAIKSMSPSTSVIVLGGVPQWHPSLPEVLVRSGGRLDSAAEIETDLNEVAAADSQLQGIAQAAGASFLPLTPFSCDGNKCRAYGDHKGSIEPFAWDYGHLTPGGSLLLAKAIAPAIEARK